VTHELESVIREHPFQERPRRQLMLALYRAGRQADALALYRDTRRVFSDELGLEPSPDLQRLEQAILRHDPALTLPAAPVPAAQGRRRGWGLAAAAAAAAVMVAVVVAAFAARSSERPTPKRAQPLGKRLVASFSVSEPSCCAFSPNAVWAVGHHDNTLYELDPHRNRVVGRFAVAGFQSEAPLDAAGSLWVPSVGSGLLVRFDPKRKKVVARIPVQGGQIAWGYLSIWLTTRNHQLDRVNIRTNKIVRRIGLAPGYNDFDDDVEVGYGSVWCTVTDASTLVRVDPATNSVTSRITGFGDTESWMPMAIGEGSVWVARVTGNWEILYRVDPSTNRIVARIRVGRHGAAWPNGFITVADGYVWTGNWDATISQVDPRTNRVVGWYRIPEHPEELTYGDGSLWVAYYDLSRIQRIRLSG
jgi:streptogramin lyase